MPKLDNSHAMVRSICPSAHLDDTGQNAGTVPLIHNISSDGVVSFVVWLLTPARNWTTYQLCSLQASHCIILSHYPM